MRSWQTFLIISEEIPEGFLTENHGGISEDILEWLSKLTL